MAVLWCGGEDLDFPLGSAPGFDNEGGHWRTGFARANVYASAPGCRTNPFAGGPVTSFWLSFQWFNYNNGNPVCGVTNSGNANGDGLFFYFNNSNPFSFGKRVSGTYTALVTDSVSTSGGTMVRADIQVVNYGATSTVNVYINQTFRFSYSGSTAISGISGFDQVIVQSQSNSGVSEIIIANESTLGWQGLVTYAPNGNGATQNWSNPAYTNIDPTSINDSNSTYVNTTGEDEQVTLNGQPSGNFQLKAVRIAARAMATSGASSTNLELGFNNTNTSVVAVGSPHALTSSFATYEDILSTDITSSGGTGAWGASLSGYELDLRSA